MNNHSHRRGGARRLTCSVNNKTGISFVPEKLRGIWSPQEQMF